MTRSEIDWAAFLGRTPGVVDTLAIARKLEGRTVAITGAGGFIGSALARAISAYSPAHLILLDAAERGLHDLESYFARLRASRPTYELIVGDICDASLLAHLCAQHRPHIVFHAAALKHVWLMESNPLAAARTNILGTQRVLEAANAAGVEQLVLVSTDKAADPASFMGATKRIAELLVLANEGANQGAVRATALRLGNVLGSTGSVAPLLERQIASGLPLTITDPACTRYFLSIDEVVRHLLSALLVEEPAPLLIPRVGDPRRIVDLARFLVERAGHAFDTFDIAYSGLRPGEKIAETLLAHEEVAINASIPGLEIVRSAEGRPDHPFHIQRLFEAADTRDSLAVLLATSEILPRYQPSPALNRYVKASAHGRE